MLLSYSIILFYDPKGSSAYPQTRPQRLYYRSGRLGQNVSPQRLYQIPPRRGGRGGYHGLDRHRRHTPRRHDYPRLGGDRHCGRSLHSRNQSASQEAIFASAFRRDVSPHHRRSVHAPRASSRPRRQSL